MMVSGGLAAAGAWLSGNAGLATSSSFCSLALLLAFLDLISFTSYAKEAQTAIFLATLTASAGCYNQWSVHCYFEQLDNNASSLT